MPPRKKNENTNTSAYRVGNIYVPDEGPASAKIVLVGEAPGETEEFERKPFVGVSGNLLTGVLGRNGLAREEIRLANLCKYRPQYNKFENVEGTPELQSGIQELTDYIRDNKPTVVVALGNAPLFYLTGKGTGRAGISAWRGSILNCILPGCEDVKVIPTYHPSYVVRDRQAYPIFDQDIKRVVYDSAYREKNLPKRNFVINPDELALEEWTQLLCSSPQLAVDIESVKKSTHILCVGFAPSAETGVCIPLTTYTHSFIQRILASPAKKIFHFGLFDTEMLWLNGFEVINYCHDTLFMQHILCPELPRSLDFLCSIYTREPYYKSSGRAEIPGDTKAWGTKADKKKLWEYNARDCCVTFECAEKMLEELKQEKLMGYYEYEISLIEAAQSIGRAGMPIDVERRDTLRNSLINRYAKLQCALDALVGHDCNVRSPKLKTVLYEELGLPARRNHQGGLTTDEDAIVSLIGFVKGKLNDLKTDRVKPEWTRKLAILTGVLKIRGVRQLISNYLNARISDDGRLRSTYKPAATETGRFAGERYVDGSGFNPQTLPRTDIEVAEEDITKKAPDISDEFTDDDDEDSDTPTSQEAA